MFVRLKDVLIWKGLIIDCSVEIVDGVTDAMFCYSKYNYSCYLCTKILIMEGLDNPVYSREVIEFVTVSNEFCKFLESSSELTLIDFVDKAHKMLPLVYLKGALLPDIEEAYEEFNEKYVTEEDYNYIKNIFIDKFGKHNFYEEIFDPLRQENDEPAQLSIAENFADIYQDIKDFLMQYRVGTDEVMYNAIWECRQAFEQYWGQRLTNVLRVLHHLKYTIVDLDNDETRSEKQSDDFDYNKINTSNWLISKRQEDFDDEE